MTAHQRNVSASIDPVKLDRLAEVAVKVGLQLQPGQDLLLTAPAVALPLVRRIAEHAYKAGVGIVTSFLSDGRSRCRAIATAMTPVSTAPPAGSMRAWQKRSPPTPRGLRSSVTIRCCCRARIPPRWRAPARPIRSPISRRWKKSSISKPTGTSSPIRARPGRSRFFLMFRRTSR